ncbi:MAP3K7 C-terminal-like protein isoform X2 [Manis pentadactyla]|nr:MAP3K7 C-terminal-like protein isoform X2 [Manis pentadactyla]
MISTARVPADKPVRIAFSLDDASDDTTPEDPTPLVSPELDQQLQPLPPCHDSLESMQVFKQHCQIAEEYHEVKKEIALLEERNFLSALTQKRSNRSHWAKRSTKVLQSSYSQLNRHPWGEANPSQFVQDFPWLSSESPNYQEPSQSLETGRVHHSRSLKIFLKSFNTTAELHVTWLKTLYVLFLTHHQA